MGFREDSTQIVRDGHGLERADVSSSGVAGRYPAEGRLGRGADDANNLASRLAEHSMPQSPEEHLDVHANVLRRGGLSQHMGSFQVAEARLSISECLLRACCLKLRVDCRADAFAK